MATARSNMDFMPRSYVRRLDKADAICRYGNNAQIHSTALTQVIENRKGFTIERERTPDVEVYQELPQVSSASIALEIADESISLPLRLKKIADSINEAMEILDYEDDWDDFGAQATDLETFKKAVSFLILYSNEILKFGVIDKPFIDIMRDGSVSIFWENATVTLLIIFKKGSVEFSHLYGEEKAQKRPFKYAIKNENKIDEILALWMSKNLV